MAGVIRSKSPFSPSDPARRSFSPVGEEEYRLAATGQSGGWVRRRRRREKAHTPSPGADLTAESSPGGSGARSVPTDRGRPVGLEWGRGWRSRWATAPSPAALPPSSQDARHPSWRARPRFPCREPSNTPDATAAAHPLRPINGARAGSPYRATLRRCSLLVLELQRMWEKGLTVRSQRGIQTVGRHRVIATGRVRRLSSASGRAQVRPSSCEAGLAAHGSRNCHS